MDKADDEKKEKKIDANKSDQIARVLCFVPQRIIAVVVGFFGILFLTSFTVSIFQIIDMFASYSQTITRNYSCPIEEIPALEYFDNLPMPSFDIFFMGFLLGVCCTGSIIGSILSGIGSDKFGAKWVLLVGNAILIACLALCPTVIRKKNFINILIVTGFLSFGQAFQLPGLMVILATWAPPKERCRLGAFMFGGVPWGIIFGNAYSLNLLRLYDWSYTFYFNAILYLAFCILLAILYFDSPQNHPCIQKHEADMLKKEIGEVNRWQTSIPLKAIWFNKPMTALLICQFGHDLGYHLFNSYFPNEVKRLLFIPMRPERFSSHLPFLCMWILLVTSGYIGDLLINRKIMRTVIQRKSMTFLSGFFPGLFMTVVTYSKCRDWGVIIDYNFAMMFYGPYYVGHKLIPMDMSPRFAGTIMGYVNICNILTVVIAPFAIRLMTPLNSIEEWRVVFWFVHLVLSVSAIVFCTWGVGDIEDYDPLKPGPDKSIKRRPRR